MKDEIKEILQLIGYCCYYGKISEDKCEKYCNYITNLQEYNQIYNIDNKEVEEIINKNDILKKYFINLKHEIIDVNKYRDEIEILRKEHFKLKEENETLRKNQRHYKNGVFSLEYDKETMSDIIDDYKSRNEKAISYINKNCVLSDEWKDLGFCYFIPIGRIEYKQLSKTKVKYLLNILQGEDKE